MQGYHFELFYFQVFVNLVGLVELEGCCEKKKFPGKQPAGVSSALSSWRGAEQSFLPLTIRAITRACRKSIELPTQDIFVESGPFDFICPD